LKKRIDETSKYIRPEEGTMEFSFMFLPSEWIYYDLLVSKVWNVHASDLIEYAFKEKKVIIVSPTSFYAYLQTVMQGLRALQIEEAAKDIQKQVEKLWKHLQAYEIYHDKLWKTLSTTVSHYNETSHKFKLIDKDVLKITQGEAWWEYEVKQLEKPEEK
jgi:DNA recombination protein RmuC